MRRSLLHLATILSTFGLGVTLTALWFSFGAPATRDGSTPRARKQACRWTAAPAPPVAPVAPIAPVAPVALADEPCEVANAQGHPPAPLSGGILNGKAVSKPAPKYPAAARAAGLSGTVVVAVVVDECGRVESASAESGPALLREASVEAARRALFSPTRLSGDPVKVRGVITYNYVLQ